VSPPGRLGGGSRVAAVGATTLRRNFRIDRGDGAMARLSFGARDQVDRIWLLECFTLAGSSSVVIRRRSVSAARH
jgi:hypothetical protein